jgi:hypothetical protein
MVVAAVPATLRSPAVLVERDTGVSRPCKDWATAQQSCLESLQQYDLYGQSMAGSPTQPGDCKFGTLAIFMSLEGVCPKYLQGKLAKCSLQEGR